MTRYRERQVPAGKKITNPAPKVKSVGVPPKIPSDSELHPVGNKGERFILMDRPPDPPLKDRYRGGEFYLEDGTLYMYSSASANPRIIVYATANAVPDPGSKVRTRDGKPLNSQTTVEVQEEDQANEKH